MIADALDGKIDRIITKSVSRFARNTVDSLVTIRELKAKGIGCYFEKENIDTLDSKGELLLTIMSSLAQEESRSISENVTWGQRKRFADGKVTMPFKRFLGYDKGPDGEPVINEEEAAIVRRIYKLFLAGKTPSGIAKALTADSIPTPGGMTVWQPTTVKSILTNEKYKGDALLQKSFTTDFLTKKAKINEGEVPQYLVEGSHPAIVSREVHALVQYEMHRRKDRPIRQSPGSRVGRACFSSRILCGECGSYFGSKVWHSTDPYRRVVWQCNRKYNRPDGVKCPTPRLTEAQLEAAFISVANQALEEKSEVLDFLEKALTKLSDTVGLDQEINRAKAESVLVQRRMADTVEENTRRALDQDEYNRRYDTLIEQLSTANLKAKELENRRLEQMAKFERRKVFLQAVRKRSSLLDSFDEELFSAMVENIRVEKDGSLYFHFVDGEIKRPDKEQGIVSEGRTDCSR